MICSCPTHHMEHLSASEHDYTNLNTINFNMYLKRQRRREAGVGVKLRTFQTSTLCGGERYYQEGIFAFVKNITSLNNAH